MGLHGQEGTGGSRRRGWAANSKRPSVWRQPTGGALLPGLRGGSQEHQHRLADTRPEKATCHSCLGLNLGRHPLSWLISQTLTPLQRVDTVRNALPLYSRVHVDLLRGFLLGEAEEKDQRSRAEGQGEGIKKLFHGAKSSMLLCFAQNKRWFHFGIM